MTRSGYTTSRLWVICTKRHGSEPLLFWSNNNGWVNLQLADIFTQCEHNTLLLLPESDLLTARQRNDVMGHKATSPVRRT